MNVHEAVQRQREFFASNSTKDVKKRKELLRKLYRVMQEYEEGMLEALEKDLNKSRMEAYVTEISQAYHEAKLMLRNIDKWSKPKSASRSLLMPFSKNCMYYEPYGVTLIIAPWNYPVNLSLLPMIGALAAGNTVLLKPSEFSVNISKVIEHMINDNFPAEYLHVLPLDTVPAEMWNERYDFIFFTGSPRIGKLVMAEAARNLTPVTLELGGKSPCVVDRKANLKMAARRIVWGKLMNAGQTCIAPDYLLVHADVKDELISLIQQEISSRYPDALHNASYPHIIDDRQFNRLTKLIATESNIIGGKSDAATRCIEPTLFPDCNWESEIMQEELFGPLLPVLSYTDLSEIITAIKSHERPLACYVFTEDHKVAERIINEVSFGGGCVNDCLMQISNPSIPFGGVGNSGMGQYHGKYSFQTFSRIKSVVKSPTWFDITVRLAPFTDSKFKFFKRWM